MLFCSFFKQQISLYIYHDLCEKLWRKKTFFLAFRCQGNGGHLGVYGTQQGTYNFKTASSTTVESCTHIEDI